MPKDILSSWKPYALMLGRRGYRRGGRNLSERPSHPARSMPRSQPSSSSSTSSWVDEKVSKLSAPALTSPSTVAAATRISRDGEEYMSFQGVKIPKKPLPPAADECCMSGCAVCIYDQYLESKQAYRTALASALAKLEHMRVPLDTWPQELRDLRGSSARAAKGGPSDAPGSPSFQDDGPPADEEDLAMMASMSAFLELEKRLKQPSSSSASSSSSSSPSSSSSASASSTSSDFLP